MCKKGVEGNLSNWSLELVRRLMGESPLKQLLDGQQFFWYPYNRWWLKLYVRWHLCLSSIELLFLWILALIHLTHMTVPRVFSFLWPFTSVATTDVTFFIIHATSCILLIRGSMFQYTQVLYSWLVHSKLHLRLGSCSECWCRIAQNGPARKETLKHCTSWIVFNLETLWSIICFKRCVHCSDAMFVQCLNSNH